MKSIISIIIVAIILIACICMLVYAAHDKADQKDAMGEDCKDSGCDGDCFHCGMAMRRDQAKR